MTKSKAVLFATPLLLLAMLLASCGEPKLGYLLDDHVILAFGDSLTEGVGVEKQHSYPTVLAQLSGRKVVNAGISGEVTEEGLARFPAVLDEVNPELVILLEGGNDILRNKDQAVTKSNLDQMITIARSRDIDVILLGVPEKNVFSSSAGFYQELADKHDIVFQRKLVASLLKSSKYKSDPIHFNEAGYRKMAEEIYQLLKENSAI